MIVVRLGFRLLHEYLIGVFSHRRSAHARDRSKI